MSKKFPWWWQTFEDKVAGTHGVEARVEENPAPTDEPWDIHFKRVFGEKNVEVTVRGARGGLKARFQVQYKDLKTAVDVAGLDDAETVWYGTGGERK
jgi:hypothetical protein